MSDFVRNDVSLREVARGAEAPVQLGEEGQIQMKRGDWRSN